MHVSIHHNGSISGDLCYGSFDLVGRNVSRARYVPGTKFVLTADVDDGGWMLPRHLSVQFLWRYQLTHGASLAIRSSDYRGNDACLVLALAQ